MQANTIIKSSWFALAPHGRMDATYWTGVVQEAMPALDIDPKLADAADVTRAIAWIASRAANDKRDTKSKREEAAILLQAASITEKRARTFS
jgi:hypothetical protein